MEWRLFLMLKTNQIIKLIQKQTVFELNGVGFCLANLFLNKLKVNINITLNAP
jgi:hypothetical protein